jgi:hypothetical protein
MPKPQTHTLEVPGAVLHYDVTPTRSPFRCARSSPRRAEPIRFQVSHDGRSTGMASRRTASSSAISRRRRPSRWAPLIRRKRVAVASYWR